MKEEMKLFLQKVAEDEELQQKLAACKSPEEAYALASSVQDGFTFEEFVETMTNVNDLVNNADELSDEDLAKISGGTNDTGDIVAEIVITVCKSIFTAGFASMAAY